MARELAGVCIKKSPDRRLATQAAEQANDGRIVTQGLRQVNITGAVDVRVNSRRVSGKHQQPPAEGAPAELGFVMPRPVGRAGCPVLRQRASQESQIGDDGRGCSRPHFRGLTAQRYWVGALGNHAFGIFG